MVPVNVVEIEAERFATITEGEELLLHARAKAGRLREQIDSGQPALPLAGCFAAGEIGPVGDTSYLHAHSACLALFRPTRRRISPTQ